MPLVKTALELALKTQLQAAFTKQFTDPNLINALTVHLDGGDLEGADSGADNISAALENVADITKDIIGNEDSSGPTVAATTSNELANGIAQAVCAFMADEWGKVMADEIAKIVADNVDIYIKSATIIVPPGQAVAGVVTISPSPPAIIT